MIRICIQTNDDKFRSSVFASGLIAGREDLRRAAPSFYDSTGGGREARDKADGGGGGGLGISGG